MKKTLSILLAVFMLLSVCAFPIAAAPEGTAITSEADFLAMTADGTYYLANNITVTKSYEALFTGTFDGNGKTVTVSAPMFVNFAGTAKNFTIFGEVTSAELAAVGALACTSLGGTKVELEKIVNNANVTGTATTTEAVVGGLIGYLGSKEINGVPLTVTDCVNNGTINGVAQTGGLVGYARFNAGDSLGTDAGATFTNCVNNGNVTASHNQAGGIIARALYTSNCNFNGCINNGDVIGGQNTGGIVGHTTSSALFMSFCQNNGKVSNHEILVEDSVYAGGLVGYGQGLKVKTATAKSGAYGNKIEFCINNGEVIGAYRAGGIISSAGASGAYGLTLVNYCVNTGNVTSRGAGTSAASNATGGILGYGYGSSTNEYSHVTNCITTGNIECKNTSSGVAAYFLAYINSSYAVIANNQALGTLASAAGNNFALGWNNKCDYAAESVGNKLPAGCTYSHAYESEATSARDFGITDTDEAALKSGALVFQLNTVYKSLTGAANDIAFQTVDGSFNITLIPDIDDNGNILNAVVPNENGGYTNPTFASPDTTEPAPDTTEPSSSGKTGDSFVIFALIAAVSVLGVAIVAKRRENN